MNELKRRFLSSILFFFITFSVVYTNSDYIIQFLIKDFDPGQLMTIHPLESIYSRFYVSSMTTLLITFPFVLINFYRYIAPALYKKEKNAVKKIIFPCSVAFLVGFCLFVVFGIKYLTYFISAFCIDEINNTISLLKYIQFIACCGAVTGVLFCYPIFIYLINAIGLINKEMLKRYRKHTIVIAFIFGALVTPPDIITQCLIAMPLIILHEISIRVI